MWLQLKPGSSSKASVGFLSFPALACSAFGGLGFLHTLGLSTGEDIKLFGVSFSLD